MVTSDGGLASRPQPTHDEIDHDTNRQHRPDERIVSLQRLDRLVAETDGQIRLATEADHPSREHRRDEAVPGHSDAPRNEHEDRCWQGRQRCYRA